MPMPIKQAGKAAVKVLTLKTTISIRSAIKATCCPKSYNMGVHSIRSNGIKNLLLLFFFLAQHNHSTANSGMWTSSM